MHPRSPFSLYCPSAFRCDDQAELHALMREHPFATVVTSGGAGVAVSHLPLLLNEEQGGFGALRGHFARANPHWRALAAGGETLAIFHGPHAYISPSWYANPASVPTWNYQVAHASGPVTMIEDEEPLLTLVAELTACFEGEGDRAWRLDTDAANVRGLLAGIVGFEMRITSLVGKSKLSQNRSEEDRDRVAAALLANGDPEAVATGAAMRRLAGRG